jgi:hypothetical protein
MPEERIRTKMWGDFVKIDAYLIEARSTGGLSGSPVFVNFGQVRVIEGQLKFGASPMLRLLGLVHGHWDDKSSNHDLISMDETSTEPVNLGVAIVIPGSQILETLNIDALLESRRINDQRLLEAASATPDAGGDQ